MHLGRADHEEHEAYGGEAEDSEQHRSMVKHSLCRTELSKLIQSGNDGLCQHEP
jgi:hypothetical protein